MRWITALLWFVAGAYGVWVALRHRRYVNGLPSTAGNRKIKRQNTAFLVGGVAMIGIGVWIAVSHLFSS